MKKIIFFIALVLCISHLNAVATCISGTYNVCRGSTVSITSSCPGGSWSSSNSAIATVSSTGVVTGLAVGTATISCNADAATVTILAAPGNITASGTLCNYGDTITLSDTSAGGSWSSSNTAKASIDVSSGVVTDVATVTSATVTMTYTLSDGCFKTYIINAYPDLTISEITGVHTLCVGGTESLWDNTRGGGYSCSNTSIATITGGGGTITPLSAGTVVITHGYSTSCPYNIDTFIVHVLDSAQPAPISGTLTFCLGTTSLLTDDSTGGTWSSSNSPAATISTSGLVTPITGTGVTITYTRASGCFVTVPLAIQNIHLITGPTIACTGSTMTLADATSGGTWSTSNSSIASIDGTGVVTGVSTGSVTISYAALTCVKTYSVTVNATPAVITGNTLICGTGTTTTLADATTGGSWASNPTSVASINSSGVVTGVSVGTATISYTKSSCRSTTTVTVGTQPAAITGTTSVCNGHTTLFADATSGGTWSSSSSAIASVDAGGLVTGVSVGSATITYAIGSCYSTRIVTVNTQPAAITGSISACNGTTTALSDATPGGTWSSVISTIASVDIAGNVTALSVGASTISYIIGSCGSAIPFTVNVQPVGITGTVSVCNGSSTLLADATSGGAWTSASPATASVDAGGVVTGISVGSTTISYSIGSCYSTVSFVVNDLPAAITGVPSICTGLSSTFSDATTGGSWSTSSSSIASVASGGLVTGVSAGSATITYTISGTGCFTTSSLIVTGSTDQHWVGGTSGHETDWHTSANWACGTVPTVTDNVTIPGASYMPVISTNNGSVYNLTVNSGSTVTVNSGYSLLTSGTNIINNGVVTGDGILGLEGSSGITLGGNGYINNLVLNNSSGATIGTSSDTVFVKGTLTLTSGTLTTNSALALFSDAYGTGRIGPIASGAGISGSIVDEQYIASGGTNRTRFWCTPFDSSITLSQFTPSIVVKKFTSDGAVGCFSALATYENYTPHWFNYNDGNMYHAGSWGDRAFRRFFDICPSANDSFRLHSYQAILLPIFNSSPVTIRTYGTVNTGDITIPLHKSDSENYYLVGNPYPSPVDIGTVIYNAWSDSLLVGNYFWVWDPYVAGGAGLGAYKAIRIDSGSHQYFIEANAGFEVRVRYNDGSSFLAFTESNKVSSYYQSLLREAPKDNGLTLQIIDNEKNQWDKVQVNFTSKATDDEDAMDAGKPLIPMGMNFYSKSGNGNLLSIDNRPYEAGKTIPLGLYTEYQQSFVLKVSSMPQTEGDVFLHDKWLHQFISLKKGTEYPFSVTADPASQGENRFELSLGISDEAILASATEASMNLSPNPANDHVTIEYTSPKAAVSKMNITNVVGTTVYEQSLGNSQNGKVTVDLSHFTPGLYLVELCSGGKKVTRKLVKE